MPRFKRKFNPKRRRRPYRRKTLTKGQRAIVRKMIKVSPEPKFYQVSSVGTGTNSEFAVDFTNISQGDTYLTREGDIIQPTSLSLSYRIIRDSGVATGSPDNVRVMVIQWHPDNLDSGNPNYADVLQDSATTSFAESPYIMNKMKRAKFTVLYDRSHRFIYERALGRDAGVYSKVLLPIKRKVKFGVNLQSGKNKIFMLVIGQQTTGTEDCSISYNGVLRFRDA